MKKGSLILFLVLSIGVSADVCHAQDSDLPDPATEQADDFDLEGAMELFKEAEDLESYEKAINSQDNEVNNLDLNEDGEVDYIRIEDNSEDQTHIIVLQSVVGEDEYQDIATIEIEKKGEEDIVVQIVGNEDIYGADYVLEPAADGSSSEAVPETVYVEQQATTTVVHVHTWPTVRFLFRPGYRVWVSPWRWGPRPGWWSPWRPIARSTWKARSRRWSRNTYRRTTTRRVAGRNIYTPVSSPKAAKKPRAAGPGSPAKASPAKSTQTQKKATTKKTTSSNKKTTTQKKSTTKKKKSGRKPPLLR